MFTYIHIGNRFWIGLPIIVICKSNIIIIITMNQHGIQISNWIVSHHLNNLYLSYFTSYLFIFSL
jgi:hypothetical protein